MTTTVRVFRESLDNPEDYFVVDYYLESTTTLRDAAWSLAIGQSVGNPNVRSAWETDELLRDHSCLVLANERDLKTVKAGRVKIAFPVKNIDFGTDGISHFLCMIMGGQLDIDIVSKCQVKEVEFPEDVKQQFLGPKYGIKGIRKFTKVYDRPLVGGIIKPKTGVSPETILEMTKQLVDGGANFIKEDEILSNPLFCPLGKRVHLIANYLAGKNVVYAFAINADHRFVLDSAQFVADHGGNAVHVNFWAGLGVYKSIRELNLPLFIHFQKSGDRIFTNPSHDYHIDWKVVCMLASMMGVDFIHAGMWGGYKNDNEEELMKVLSTLRSGGTMPALSCGLHPGLVDVLTRKFGVDFLANAGGAIHGHPMGSEAGVKAMVQATKGQTEALEYKTAINKWGLVHG